jgi:CxxC motif-containing protein (DUF1111 family)
MHSRGDFVLGPSTFERQWAEASGNSSLGRGFDPLYDPQINRCKLLKNNGGGGGIRTRFRPAYENSHFL